MMRKLIISIILLFSAICIPDALCADYNPPFELSGVVVSINADSIEVHMPYINKQVNVQVAANTKISNRLKAKDIFCKLSEITAEDLVVIKGVVQKEIFLGTEISFLPN